jgi:hypothetical protein
MTWEDYQTLHAEAAAIIEEELSQLMPSGGRAVTVQGGVVSLRQELPAAAAPRDEGWLWTLFGRISQTIEKREDGDVTIESSGLSPWQAIAAESLRGGYGPGTLGNQFDHFLVVENRPWRRVRFEAVFAARVLRWHHAQALLRSTTRPDEVMSILTDPRYGGSTMRLIFLVRGYYGLHNNDLPEGERFSDLFTVPAVVGAQPTSFTVPITDTGSFVLSLLRVERV